MRCRLGISVFATAILASAAAHALVLATFTAVRVGSPGAPREFAEMAVVFDGPEAESGPDASELDIGLPEGKGYATHDLDGRREQQAREAPQDQPSLSLDPIGNSRLVDIPSPPGDTPAVTQTEIAPPPPAIASAAPPVPFPSELPRDVTEQVRRERIETITPGRGTETVPPPQRLEALAPLAAPAIAAPARSAPATPAPGQGADAAPQGDSESDAFSVLGSAQFRAGRVTVQSGRQVKTRRPRIGLAGMVELAHRGSAEVVLKVSVDKAGKVTNVDVADSSGSNDIDQPCRVAMYDWWFAPKDAAGRPLPDVFRFTISFR